MDWISLITTLGGYLGMIGCGIAWLLNYRNQKRINDSEAQKTVTVNDAEAVKAIKDLYEELIKDMHNSLNAANENIKVSNETITNLLQRIKAQNQALDEKTDRIRKITDDLAISESKNNQLNEEIKAITKSNNRMKLFISKLLNIRCYIAECGKRIPKVLREKLKGKTTEEVIREIESTDWIDIDETRTEIQAEIKVEVNDNID